MQVVETNIQFNALIPRKATRRIVLHHSASGANTTWQDIQKWHLNNGWAGIGYHYVIHPDGSIYRGRPEGAAGAHAYQDSSHEANSDGIGICLIGNFETGAPTEAQLAGVVELVRDIWTRYPGIPVIGHKDVMATACPGKNFPWEELKIKLAEGVIDVALEKWQIEGGQAAISELVKKGLINNPENWNFEEELAKAVPAYLFWMMLNRIVEYKGGK